MATKLGFSRTYRWPTMLSMGNDARELISRIDDLPPFPAVAARVMSMAEDDRVGAMDLAQVLSTDQALTARLIRISNSAYFGFARKVSTVREAVVLLGFKQVRQIAVGASVMSAFKPQRQVDDGFDLDLFWGHSVAVAVAAENAAKKLRAAKPEDAFTAGIVHDMGRLALRQIFPAEFAEAVAAARAGEGSLHEAEVAITGYGHDAIGQALAEAWKFPGHLIDAVACHHDERVALNDGVAGLVAHCDALLHHYGLYCGYELETEEQPPLPARLAEIDGAIGGLDRVLERSFAFIESASGSPERWYAKAA